MRHIQKREDKIRVAVLVSVMPPYRFPLYTHLAADSHLDLRVFLEHPEPPWRSGWKVAQKPPFKITIVKTLLFRGFSKKFIGDPYVLSVGFDLLPRIWNFNPNVIISQEFGFRTITALMYKFLFSPRSHLIVFSEATIHSERDIPFQRQIERRVIAHGTDAFCTYGREGSCYLQSLGVTKEKIHIVPMATDVTRFISESNSVLMKKKESPPDNNEPFTFLYVGQLINRKGLKQLLDAWSDMPHQFINKCKLKLVGNGHLYERLTTIAKQLSLRIEVHPHVSYDDVPRVFANASVFILPTLEDTWGLVVNEAMAAGLPVLCSKYAGASELLIHGKTGFIFDPLIKQEIIAALKWAYANHQRFDAIRISVQGRIKKFNYDTAYRNLKAAVMHTSNRQK